VIPRIYLPPGDQQSPVVTLDAEQSLYISQALRLRAGEPLQVFDGIGHRRQASLVKSDRKACQIELGPPETALPPAPVSITLVQGIAQGDRMDWVVEKAVEMGIARIFPVQTSRSQVRLSEERAIKRVNHWRRVAIAACRQCGRDDLPDIQPVQVVDSALQALASSELSNGETSSFVLQPASEQSLSSAVSSHESAPRLAHLLVGPESGLSDAEVDKAVALGWSPVSLGPRVLRTETAGIVAITILQAGWGDLASCAKASI